HLPSYHISCYCSADPPHLPSFPTRRSSDLRSLLRRVLQEYAAEGLRPVVASELEFFLFEPNPDPLRPFEPPRGLDGRTSDAAGADRKSTRLNSSHVKISYAVFCLKKKKKKR